jgi:hypothetical protein
MDGQPRRKATVIQFFGTLLTSFFINTLGFSAAAAGIASSITTAISAGGGYMEFRR